MHVRKKLEDVRSSLWFVPSAIIEVPNLAINVAGIYMLAGLFSFIIFVNQKCTAISTLEAPSV